MLSLEIFGRSEPMRAVTGELDAADGVRLVGPAGGAQALVTAMEIDALAPSPIVASPTFDLTGDGRRDAEDLYLWHTSAADLDGDGDRGDADRRYLQTAVRWVESADATSP